MNEPIFLDAEYESLRSIFKSRGGNAGQLPKKAVTFIPTERAEAVQQLDQRIQTLRKYAPWILMGAISLISFLAGTCV